MELHEWRGAVKVRAGRIGLILMVVGFGLQFVPLPLFSGTWFLVGCFFWVLSLVI